jgi:allantoinase
MTPRRYGPLAYVPITRRPQLTWPDSARVALWVNPNIEFFGLDDIMPGNQNERVPHDNAKIPNVRNWAVRDYGNRVGIWRIMEVLTRYGIRASAAINSEVCDHHPEIIEEAGRHGWELIGHNQTNALRLTEMDGAEVRKAVYATIDRIAAASGKRPVGWLGAGLAETWNTLDYLAEAGIRYVCDWVNDDQPYLFEIGSPPLVSLPYSVQTNDVPAYFDMKVSVPEFEAMLRRQFDTLYREGETTRVMAIAVHPFVTGQPHRIGALDSALEYICSHAGVWPATAWEIVQHFFGAAAGIGPVTFRQVSFEYPDDSCLVLAGSFCDESLVFNGGTKATAFVAVASNFIAFLFVGADPADIRHEYSGFSRYVGTDIP